MIHSPLEFEAQPDLECGGVKLNSRPGVIDIHIGFVKIIKIVLGTYQQIPRDGNFKTDPGNKTEITVIAAGFTSCGQMLYVSIGGAISPTDGNKRHKTIKSVTETAARGADPFYICMT